jgi:Cys-tRNA(Pro)/Cys-tRNA(Cys) deacylase
LAGYEDPAMSDATRATLALSAEGIPYATRRYDYDPNADRTGLQAAEALGLPPGQVFKTLMTKADGKPVCVIAPSDKEVAMKTLAAAVGARGAGMMNPRDAERATGYVVGGISPFAQRKAVPTVLDESALGFEHVWVNAGQRGLLLAIMPQDVVKATGALVAAVTR